MNKGPAAKAPKLTVHRKPPVAKGKGGRVHDADVCNYLERDRLPVTARVEREK